MVLIGATLIRQIAALPFRTALTAAGPPLSILLITSRETKRWVIPKGNPMRSVPPHSAAAIEAEEEAGVRGSVSPTPLGSYRYRKKRRDGAALMFEVDVFALAVTHELQAWKEKDQRERRWFSPAEAADAVEEEDLAELIRSFDPSQFDSSAPPGAQGAAATGRVKSLFGWVRRRLP